MPDLLNNTKTNSSENVNPFDIILDNFLALPDPSLLEDNEKINCVISSLASTDSFEKESADFFKDLNLCMMDAMTENQKEALLSFFTLLRNNNFFNSIAAFNAALTLFWNNNTGEQTLGGDEAQLIFQRLLPENTQVLNELNKRLNMLWQLSQGSNADAYVITMLATSVKHKLEACRAHKITPTVDINAENPIDQLVKQVSQEDFISSTKAYEILLPIKATTNHYHEQLLHTLFDELRKTPALFEKYKYQEIVVGRTCLLNIEKLLADYDQRDKNLIHFINHNTRFRVNLDNYLAIQEINAHQKQFTASPNEALVNFKQDFDRHAAKFEKSEDGPTKRFFNTIVQLLKCCLPIINRPKEEKNTGRLFVKNMLVLFPDKRLTGEEKPLQTKKDSMALKPF